VSFSLTVRPMISRCLWVSPTLSSRKQTPIDEFEETSSDTEERGETLGAECYRKSRIEW
jgi:hypothetical protein